MFDYISFAGLALLLGFKHSYDPDHIIVVANFLRKVDTLKSAVRVSVRWAVGHMITAAIVTTLLYAFRESVIHTFLANFEKVAGVVLIALGLFSLKDFFSLHSHPHKHEETEHSHPHTHPSECNIGNR